jgi:hypothetical protein
MFIYVYYVLLNLFSYLEEFNYIMGKERKKCDRHKDEQGHGPTDGQTNRRSDIVTI